MRSVKSSNESAVAPAACRRCNATLTPAALKIEWMAEEWQEIGQ
jgi:hypothetical protein